MCVKFLGRCFSDQDAQQYISYVCLNMALHTPEEPGVYFAKSKDSDEWDSVCIVTGEHPFFDLMVIDLKTGAFVEDASLAIIDEFSEKCEPTEIPPEVL
jgi:hypothetical protein